MSIEQNYDISFIAELALREKQIQQNYRPIIAVHKWFARRPGTLFRGLLLSEFGRKAVRETFYETNDFRGTAVADPFMGGGTPLLEANRVGCDVVGVDVNPMAAWVVREEIDDLDEARYLDAATDLREHLHETVGDLYKTTCPVTGNTSADVKYFLWVKTGTCVACEKEFDLFPGYTVAEDVRHTAFVLVCAACGNLNEVADRHDPGACSCGHPLRADGPVKRNKCACPHCGHVNASPFHGSGPPRHRLFAIEYVNPQIKKRRGRLFKKPDAADLERVKRAEEAWQAMQPRFVPDDRIPEGDESSRPRRWGYDRFRDLFNARQLLALETSARVIASVADERTQRALATNFSDLLRYQNMLCRYDTMALKSLDIFSIHGFPVGYVQVESNFPGIRDATGKPVGSGGWVNIVDKYAKAKRYCTAPFEVEFTGKKKVVRPIPGEWIGRHAVHGRHAESRRVDIRCASSTEVSLPEGTLDAVFTDPPYFGMVQYGELMQFCYVWLRKLMGAHFAGLENDTTRHADELTGNATAQRGIEHFAEGLASVFGKMAVALKPGAPLAFTYHHNQSIAYQAAAVGILDAGLTCTASLPCPAEMSGSIHIQGTGSSIVDTVFVCRKNDVTPPTRLFADAEGLAGIVRDELADLRKAGMKPTPGDIRCITYGHLTRMAIRQLRDAWDRDATTAAKLESILRAMNAMATLDKVQAILRNTETDRHVAPATDETHAPSI